MRFLRSALRLKAIALTTLAFYVSWAAGHWLCILWPKRRIAWRNTIFRNWSRSILWLAGARVDRRGLPPEPPFLLVSNHLSYLDILTLASSVDAVFIAKSEVARWPVVGHLCRAMGTVFIDRNNARDIPRVLERIRSVLERGQSLVFFPEGTTSPGAQVAPFRPALLAAAAEGNLPVSYASLSYRTGPDDPPAHQAVCWWGDMDFAGHFAKMTTLSGFEAVVTFGSKSIRATDRKVLAHRLREAVVAQFEPTTTEEAF